MKDRRGRPDVDREAEREVRRRDLERPKPRALLSKADRGDDACRPGGNARVHLDQPFLELTAEVSFVEETALLEEGALHPADEVLDRALLVRAPRPADLDADAESFGFSPDGGYFAELGPKLNRFYLERDVLLRALGNVVYVLPPYCTTLAELDRIYDVIDESFALVSG